jgi:hypothetical protein
LDEQRDNARADAEYADPLRDVDMSHGLRLLANDGNANATVLLRLDATVRALGAPGRLVWARR